MGEGGRGPPGAAAPAAVTPLAPTVGRAANITASQTDAKVLFCRGMNDLVLAAELLERLNRAEKAQLLQWIARDLGDAFPGIESVTGVCGGDAVVVRTRIPVWLLEQARRAGLGDAEILSAYPTLRAEDLVNAWAYSRSHRAEIDEQIRANEADDESPLPRRATRLHK